MKSCASRSRITGSSAAVWPPCDVDCASLIASWMCVFRAACAANARPARSFMSVVIATPQPFPTPPTMFSSGM
jgi:hypothetical protein